MNKKPDAGYSSGPLHDGDLDEVEKRLAEVAAGLFPPVRPTEAFRRQLRDNLLAVMCRKTDLQVLAPVEGRRWALIVGATVGSLVSICGVAAYLVRSRLMEKPQHAASQ
jgi:hypothetical protein